MSFGDHLAAKRQHGLFNHHGIDLGNEAIAHYLEGRQIIISPLKEFSKNQPTHLVTYNNVKTSPKEITVSRALSRVGEQNYNLLFNNCEHFATWCKTGRHKSGQVDSVVTSILKISNLIPPKIIKYLELHLGSDLTGENNRALIQAGIKKLEKSHQLLLEKLKTLLSEVNSNKSRRIVVLGQNIADEITHIEELKDHLCALLEKLNTNTSNEV